MMEDTPQKYNDMIQHKNKKNINKSGKYRKILAYK